MPSSSYCIRLSIDVFFIHHSIVIISFNCNYAAVVMTSLHSCLRAFDSQHTVIQSSSRHGQHTLVVIPLSSSHCHIVVIIQLNPTITKSAGKLKKFAFIRISFLRNESTDRECVTKRNFTVKISLAYLASLAQGYRAALLIAQSALHASISGGGTAVERCFQSIGFRRQYTFETFC